jgi:hypothetical protein
VRRSFLSPRSFALGVACVLPLLASSLAACGKHDGKDAGGPIASASASASSLPLARLPKLHPKLLSLEVESCFSDLGCAVAEQQKRLLKADERGATDLVCDRFVEGIGVPADVSRGRRCLERRVSAYGQSPETACDRETLSLALLAYQGIGGRKEAPIARGLLARCLDDPSVQKALALGEESLASKRQKPIDFCEDVAETPLHRNQCLSLAALRSRTKATDTFKGLAPDEAQRKLLTTLAAHWKDLGELDDQRAIVGLVEPARSSLVAAREAQSMRRFAALADVLAAYQPRDLRDVEKLDEDVRARMRSLAGQAAKESPSEKGSYRALRDAAVEVFVSFHGKKVAKPLIIRDVQDRLDEERAREVFGDGKK